MRKTTYRLPNSSSLRTIAHDVDGMLALCADGALGRYAPYGRESVVPIRGGIDVIWRAFPNAVPNFRVKVIELIPAEGNIVVIQAEMSGPIPAKVHGVAKKGQDVHIPHCYILRFDTDSKITRLDAYWDNTVVALNEGLRCKKRLPARWQTSRATSGRSFASAGRVINFNVAATLFSESTFRNGDWFRETLSAVFSVSSKTGSPVSLLKSARTMVSFSVRRCVVWRERK